MSKAAKVRAVCMAYASVLQKPMVGLPQEARDMYALGVEDHIEALEDARACAIRDVAVFCTELRANLKVPEDAMGDYDRGSLVALALVINRCEQMLKEGWPK